MKRLLSTLALAASMLAGCNQAGTTATTADSVGTMSAKALVAPQAGTIVRETLDGIPEKDALQMIKNFQTSSATQTYPIESFFIKKDMLVLLNDMLAKEMAAPLTGGRNYHTDGIRIYFGKEQPTSTNIKLIIVSTTDSIGFIPPPPAHPSTPPDKMHHDYYDHLQAALHQTTVPLKITPEPLNLSGALLRTVCNCDFEASCATVNRPGAIVRSYAEKMVQNFNGRVMTTHSVWFDAARLRKMVGEQSFAGLRIYMATYHDNTYNANGKSTFVLTTVDNTNSDYFYCENDTTYFMKNGKRIIRYRPLWGPAEDNGSLCPNNCN
ncbi:MAG: hypothetical protein V4553_10600 [Bacteroidota bacterium]